MPTKRTHIGRKPISAPLADSERAWLLDEPHEFTFIASERREAALWEANKVWATQTFAAEHPGRRPYAWWTYSAPRWADDGAEGWYYHGTLPEPRLRLGGIGTPCYECLNVAPHFHLGLPGMWVSSFDEAYYNGRARDVHGDLIVPLIGEPYAEGHFSGRAIDPNDPPRYESQAAYLKRHGLLLPGEARRLKPADFEPELVRERFAEQTPAPPRGGKPHAVSTGDK